MYRPALRALPLLVGLLPLSALGQRRAPDASALFETLPVVEAASLHAQTLEDAPASVTVITDQEIRTYGYRTLGEALAGARGFYLSYDRAYHYAGLRGFSLPGDYNTRFLVMLNGHYLTENIYSSNGFFGQDFGLDLDLVKRIEIIRGPSSALYGSNGMFATVNIVTRSPVEHETGRAAIELGSFGERKAHVSSAAYLGRGASLLVSASAFHTRGQGLEFPELGSAARNCDAERGYHSWANLIWRDWSVAAYFNAREKRVPTGSFGTLFGDSGNQIRDSRNFIEASWSRDAGASGKLRWRWYYDQYRYSGRYDYQLEDAVEDFRDLSRGDWLGTQLSYGFKLPRLGRLTVGGEWNADVQAEQRNFTVAPAPLAGLHIDRPDRSWALFAQQEWELGRSATAWLGLRLDDSRNHRRYLSPRLALNWRGSARTAYKFLYGRAFRHPNQFESYYDDRGLSQLPNPGLRPESIDTLEVAAERRLGREARITATLYHYWLADLIQATPAERDLLQFRNLSRSRAGGLEVEAGGPLGRQGVEATASLAFQRTVDAATRARLPNSPAWVAKLRLAAPLARIRVRIAASASYWSTRATLGGGSVAPVPLAGLTLSTHRLHPNFDLQAGIRNLLGRTYFDPVGAEHALDRLRADGRTAFVKLIWHSRE